MDTQPDPTTNNQRDLRDLRGNPNNPRKISKDDFESLKRSIQRFGDLGGIIFNVHTQQLVGGHQRTEAFKRLGKEAHIEITEKFEQADKYGTVAMGYVVMDGAKYSYREVSWSQNWETAANIAANRISGEFDLELLAQANIELAADPNASDLLELTGQTEAEIEKLLGKAGVGDEGEAPAERNVLEVDCVTDETLQQLYQELTDRGFKCRVLNI